MAIGFKGTSISDIEQGAEDALEEDIGNLSAASNSVAGQLDGGINTGTDWSTKTYKSAIISGGSTFSVSGSGYLLAVFKDGISASSEGAIIVDIDGSNLIEESITKVDGASNTQLVPTIRFENSLNVEASFVNSSMQVVYALD